MMFLEVSEHFMDMDMMGIGIVGVDEDVVQVNEDANIEEVTKNVIHESLEGSWRISKSERHNTPFKGAIAGLDVVYHSSPLWIQTRW